MGSEATWYLCGLSGVEETLNRNILHPTVRPNQQILYM